MGSQAIAGRLLQTMRPDAVGPRNDLRPPTITRPLTAVPEPAHPQASDAAGTPQPPAPEAVWDELAEVRKTHAMPAGARERRAFLATLGRLLRLTIAVPQVAPQPEVHAALAAQPASTTTGRRAARTDRRATVRPEVWRGVLHASVLGALLFSLVLVSYWPAPLAPPAAPPPVATVLSTDGMVHAGSQAGAQTATAAVAGRTLTPGDAIETAPNGLAALNLSLEAGVPAGTLLVDRRTKIIVHATTKLELVYGTVAVDVSEWPGSAPLVVRTSTGVATFWHGRGVVQHRTAYRWPPVAAVSLPKPDQPISLEYTRTPLGELLGALQAALGRPIATTEAEAAFARAMRTDARPEDAALPGLLEQAVSVAVHDADAASFRAVCEAALRQIGCEIVATPAAAGGAPALALRYRPGAFFARPVAPELVVTAGAGQAEVRSSTDSRWVTRLAPQPSNQVLELRMHAGQPPATTPTVRRAARPSDLWIAAALQTLALDQARSSRLRQMLPQRDAQGAAVEVRVKPPAELLAELQDMTLVGTAGGQVVYQPGHGRKLVRIGPGDALGTWTVASVTPDGLWLKRGATHTYVALGR